jgi:predicted nucleic acid-binding Zn ribbon protein
MCAKRGNEFTIKQAIQDMMHTYRLQGKVDEVNLLNGWEKVMGSAIAKYTRKLHIDNRILYVELTSAALRAELSYGREKMVVMLNESAGGSVIDDIVLR